MKLFKWIREKVYSSPILNFLPLWIGWHSTDIEIDPNPILEVTKTVTVTDNGDGYTGSGDVANYTITVENKQYTQFFITLRRSLNGKLGISLRLFCISRLF